MTAKTKIEFAIEAFEIQRFSCFQPDKTVRKERFDFNIRHSFEIDSGRQRFIYNIHVKVLSGKQKPVELAVVDTRTVFKLKGIAKDGLRLTDELLITFLGIAYSNTRGALAAKAQGTIAGDVPLPLINPASVIKKVKKELESKSAVKFPGT